MLRTFALTSFIISLLVCLYFFLVDIILVNSSDMGKVVTITLISHINGALCALVCHRGVGGLHHGRIISQGGAVDRGESLEAAAARELQEEAGIIMPPEKLIFLSEKGNSIFNFYCIVEHDIQIKGPDRFHAWEVIQDHSLIDKFPQADHVYTSSDLSLRAPAKKSHTKRYTGLSWVTIEELLKRESELMPIGYELFSSLLLIDHKQS